MLGVDAAESVARWTRDDFGLDLVALETIEGGLDPAARVWLAHDGERGAWAVKITSRDNRFGLLLAQALTRAGVIGVPDQLTGPGGLPWSERGEGRLSISRWIEGREAFETGLTRPEWQSLGMLLRRVHEQEPPPVSQGPAVSRGPAGSRGPSEDLLRRGGIHRAGIRLAKGLRAVDRLVAERIEVPGAAPEVDRFVAEWPGIRTRIVRLRDSAKALKKVRTPTRRVSCHGDPHLGNVLVDPSGQPWLIDFDDAVRAPREVDLMLIELGVLYAMPISDSDRESFYVGYGDVELDHDRVVRFGCIRAVEDLLENMQDLLLGHPERSPADLDTVIRGVLSPTGLAGLVAARHDSA